MLEEAAAAARRAMAINPRHPLATMLSGLLAGALDWNWREFDRLCGEGYALAPNDPDVASHNAFWRVAKIRGRYDEALSIYDGIAVRDPLSGNWRAFQSALAYHKRDYVRARSYARAAIEITANKCSRTGSLAQWQRTPRRCWRRGKSR